MVDVEVPAPEQGEALVWTVALELIGSGAADAGEILAKLAGLKSAAGVIRDTEKNPGNDLKVNLVV